MREEEEEWEARLRRPPSMLPPPPGAFDRIRRTARARRRNRAIGAGAAAVLTAAVLAATPAMLRDGGFDFVGVRPPVAEPPASGGHALPPRNATESSEVILPPTGPGSGSTTEGGPSAGPSSGGGGPEGSATAAAPPACGEDRLTATMTEPAPGEAFGSRTAALVLTNASPGSCLIDAGSPELALLDGERAAIETETVPATTPRQGRILVAPGAAVRAGLSWTTLRQADELLGCFPVPAWLRARPQGGLTWLETGWRGQEVCRHGRVEVGPLRREA